ncbi:MAG: hypothetical protein Q8K99_02345 [Actinomycetota bacterium]|nr:hypothetical protein [Actinomycetota bacterium]
MNAPTIIVLGRRLRPLEPVSTIAELLSMGRGAAFRACRDWPTTGTPGARKVVVPALLTRLEIPFEVETADEVLVTHGGRMADSCAEHSVCGDGSAGEGPSDECCPRDSRSVARSQ